MHITKRTIKELMEKSIEKYGERPALSFYNSEPISYKELGAKIKAVQEKLKERGIIKGDKIAIIGENSPNWGIAYLGITTMGAVAVPILPDFPAEDIAHIINHSESHIAFVTKKQLDKLSEVDIRELEVVITLDDFTMKESKYELEPISRMLSIASDFIRSIPIKLGIYTEEVQEEDLAAIIYTSGTTGHSKGVMLTHRNIASNVLQIYDFFDLKEGERILSILPLSHAYECTLGFLYPLFAGCTIYYIGKKPTARTLREAAGKVKPNVIAAVPLIIEKIYKREVQPALRKNLAIRFLTFTPLKSAIFRKIGKKMIDFFGGQLRTMAFGGAPLGLELEKFLRKAKFPYAVGYGLTETSPVLTGAKVGETKLGSAGRPLMEVEIKIADPDPKTGIGEIWVRGPNIMKGYYKNKELTKEVLTEDGWLKTGDLGYLDKDEYLYIKGRSKNMILGPNGENIFPETIEEKLNMHPYVEESLVIEREGVLEAWIYIEPSFLEKKLEGKSEAKREEIINEILEEIRQEVNEKLPAFAKIKRCVEHPAPFEKTPTHKIKRYLYYHPTKKRT